MPKTNRNLLQRKVGYCIANQDTVIEHALDVRAEFLEYCEVDPTDSDYMTKLKAEADSNSKARFVLLLELAMLSAGKTQQLFEQFGKHAWGYVPDKVERWTNTGQRYREEHQK